MPHGLRVLAGRVARTGLGVVLCTSLLGCMNDDRKLINPMGKSGQPGSAGVGKAGQPNPNAALGGQYGAGAQPGSVINQPGGMGRAGAAGGTNFQNPPLDARAQPGHPGSMGVPAVPTSGGALNPNQGFGAAGGTNPVVPSVAPMTGTGTSQYQHPGPVTDTPAGPTSSVRPQRGDNYANAAPIAVAGHARPGVAADPPAPALVDMPTPPAPPPGGITPSVSPIGDVTPPLPPAAHPAPRSPAGTFGGP
jgi:hypothetical protein